MTEAEAASLELGYRPIQRIVPAVNTFLGQTEVLLRLDQSINFPSIIFPVCCDLKRATSFDFLRRKLQKTQAQYAALMMAFLWPRVWKIEIDSTQGIIRNLISQDIDGIVTDKPDVRYPGFLCV